MEANELASKHEKSKEMDVDGLEQANGHIFEEEKQILVFLSNCTSVSLQIGWKTWQISVLTMRVLGLSCGSRLVIICTHLWQQLILMVLWLVSPSHFPFP